MFRSGSLFAFVCGLCLVSQLGCVDAGEASTMEGAASLIEYSQPAADAPKFAYWGQYGVGIRTLAMTDADRLALLDIDPETGLPRRADRSLEALVWYPADVSADGLPRARYTRQFIQDPSAPMPGFPRTWTTSGHAFAEAPALPGARFPLVVLAHGWSGNSASLVYLGENLASKGYIVVAPDLRDVAPDDPQMFELLFPRAMINRAIDIHFVLETLSDPDALVAGWLSDIMDTEKVALIGNSLGGMGALRVAGAVYDGESPGAGWIPAGLFANQTGEADAPLDVTFEGLDALILIAPWGAQQDVALFSEDALSDLTMPLLVVAGDLDAIAGYKTGPRRVFEQAGAEQKYLLTFEAAGHGLTPGPVPRSAEGYPYGAIGTRDAVWRNQALASVQQHFITAFLNEALKDDDVAGAYLEPKTLRAADGVWPPVANEGGDTFAPVDVEGVSYWPGFRRHRARGLRWEVGQTDTQLAD